MDEVANDTVEVRIKELARQLLHLRRELQPPGEGLPTEPFDALELRVARSETLYSVVSLEVERDGAR